MMNDRKIGVIGCGLVGSTVAYSLMVSRLCKEIVLLDIDDEKARCEAMDLNHCLPFLSPMQIYAGNYNQLSDCGIVIVSAGAGQAPDETRPALYERNAAVFKSVIPRIADVNRDCILLVLTNPVDSLTALALRLSGFPAARVIGSGTVLDTARLKYLIGEKLQIDSRNVHAFMIGEHGDSELPVWSSANVSGMDLKTCFSEACRDEDLYGLFSYVKESAYEMIRGKGATCYAIAQAALRIVQAIVRDENAVLPVSVSPEGVYGLQEVCLGLPCVIGQRGVRRVLEIPLDCDESRRLRESSEILREQLEAPLPMT